MRRLLSGVRSFGMPAGVLAALMAATGLVSLGCPKPPDRTPPSPVSSFQANAGDAEVVLNWTNPTNPDLAGVRVQRSTAGFPSSPTDGSTVFEGEGITHTDTTAANGTQYYYSAFAFDDAGNFATGAQASATPTSATASVEILTLFSDLRERLAKVPANIFSENERGILIGLLEESEGLYRAGDPCGSSGGIVPMLDELQRLRAGAAVETAEDFYNDSRMLRYDMLLAVEEKANCPGAERIGIETLAEAEEEDELHVQAVGLFSEPIVRTLVVEHGEGTPVVETFTQVDIPGTDGDLGDPGKPAVPIYRTLIAAPRGATVALDLEKQSFEVAETIKMNLVPTQEQPVDQIAFDPEFADKPFVLDENVYNSDQPYPAERATIQFIGDARDMELYLLEVAAGQYHPQSNTFDLFDNIRVTPTFKGGEGFFVTEASLNLFESGTPVYTNAVLNKNSVLQHVGEFLAPRLTGEELLILTHPNFLDAAIRLRDHKRANGMWANVFEVGTGSGIQGRTTRTEIDDFIENRYNSVVIRPSYILLLGDAEFIPVFYQSGIGTDWPYAILGNVGVDTVPDFAIGRIPVDSLGQADVVIDKIIAYEDTPPFSPTFYNNAAIAAQFQCCRTGATNAGTDQRTFIQVSEFARNVMTNAGKNVQRIYMQTVDSNYSGNTTPRRYYNGSFLPAAIGAGSGFAWDGDTTDVINAFNAGRFLFMHRDHGWEDGWADPLFSSNNVSSLNNGALQPVVFSVNCASGFFDNETAGGAYGTTVNGVYWAERMLRRENGGAVGILGDTRNSPSWANSTLTQGFFDAIWSNAIPSFGGNNPTRRLGDILNHGKLYLCSKVGFQVMGATISSSSAIEELYLWHVIGDPSMKIRTSAPLLILPAFLEFHELQTGLNLTYPQDGAEITVYQVNPTGGDPEPIARGIVDNGVAVADFVRPRNSQLPLSFVASLDDAVTTEVDAEPTPQ